MVWQERGPNNIGGRTRGILVDRNDATGNTVFAAGVGGGLWKTTNFKSVTPNWAVVDDFFANIAITCIKQSPTNASEMYFGTGEGWGNIDAIQGLGIWRSTDEGTTWTQLSSTTGIADVEDLEYDNNGYIYASTRATTSTLRGVLRSADGGTTWVQVLTDPTYGTTRGADLERGPNGDMYATLGIFSTGHIFRSPSNGTSTGTSGTWTEITPSGITTNGYQRTEMAICPNNSSRIYAIAQDGTADGIGAMYRSDNYGASWATLSNASWCDQGSSTNTDFSRGQAWYDLIMAVDPNNSNTVMAGGVVIEKSADSGKSWSQITRWTTGATCNTAPVIHADIHEIIFLNSNELIVGTDGGIYYSSDGGASFTNKNNGYNVTQYYGVAVNPANGSNYMLAGAQDNGSHKFTTSGINSVTSPTGGDGAFCFINQTNSNYQITSYTDANYNVSSNGGTSFSQVVSSSNGRFINPAALDDKNNILYFAYTDGEYGHYDVTNGGGATIINLTSSPSSLSLTNLQVSAIKIDTNQTNVIWLAFSTSETASSNVVPVLVKVIRSNGPSSGSSGSKPLGTLYSLPGSIPAGAYISSIDVEPGNSNHIIITLSNYGVISIWESTDSGTTWASIEGNLPDMPVRWGLFIPSGYNARNESTIGGVMLATELGVWSTSVLNGSSTSWVPDNSGLANVRTDQLVLRNSDKLVAAATHGRGVFTSTLLSTPLGVTLLDFTGSLQKNNILLNWNTSSEYNSNYFDLEKSYDGVQFHKIATVQAAGNSTILQQYNYLDNELPVEMNYYRLKMVDITGQYVYSNVKLIRNTALGQNIYILGNPFTDNIQIKFARIPKGSVSVRLLDASGKTLFNSAYNKIAQNQIQINVNKGNLISGIYILQVQVDGKNFVEKVVKR